jgi:hypothetical protein
VCLESARATRVKRLAATMGAVSNHTAGMRQPCTPVRLSLAFLCRPVKPPATHISFRSPWRGESGQAFRQCDRYQTILQCRMRTTGPESMRAKRPLGADEAEGMTPTPEASSKRPRIARGGTAVGGSKAGGDQDTGHLALSIPTTEPNATVTYHRFGEEGREEDVDDYLVRIGASLR